MKTKGKTSCGESYANYDNFSREDLIAQLEHHRDRAHVANRTAIERGNELDAMRVAHQRQGDRVTMTQQTAMEETPPMSPDGSEPRIWLHIRGEGNEFHGRLPASRILPTTELMLEFIAATEREKRLPEYEI